LSITSTSHRKKKSSDYNTRLQVFIQERVLVRSADLPRRNEETSMNFSGNSATASTYFYHCMLQRDLHFTLCISNLNLLEPLLHQGNCFLAALEGIVDVHKIIGKLVVPVGHQINEDVQVMNAIEDQRLLLGKLIR